MNDELGLDLEGLLRQRDWLRALARGLVRESEVDDLLQESWLGALRAGSGPRRSLRAWFAGLARNAARAPRRRKPVPEADWAAIADAAPTADELLARAELQERLIAAVRALREPYRSTVLQHYFQGLSLEELGRQQGVPGSTARTRLARALAELRERLGREPGGGAWSLVVALAREGAAPVASTVANTVWEVTLMGTLLKVGGTALAAGVVFVVWTRLEGADERGPTAREAPATAAFAESSRVAVPPARTQAPSVDPRSPVASPPEVVREAPAAAPGAPPVVAASPLERWLDAIADTFLTEEPDVAGLLSLSTALADGVTVVPESLQLKESGTASGKLEAGGNLSGTFTFDGREYKVELSSWNTPAPLPRSFSLQFTEENGVVSDAHLRVGSTPLKDPAHLIGGQELIGWRLSIDPVEGAKLYRTKMQVDDMSPAMDHYLYEISDVQDAEPRAIPWITSADVDPWLARLRPLRQR